MSLFKSFILAVTMISALFVFTAPVTSYAAGSSSDEACQALLAVNPSGKCDKSAESSLTKILRVVLQLLSAIAAVIAVIMLIVSGLKYITSQGDAAGAASARNTLVYAIVGIVIVVFAQIIVKFVLKKSAGV
jgi:hypothetical protein